MEKLVIIGENETEAPDRLEVAYIIGQEGAFIINCASSDPAVRVFNRMSV